MPFAMTGSPLKREQLGGATCHLIFFAAARWSPSVIGTCHHNGGFFSALTGLRVLSRPRRGQSSAWTLVAAISVVKISTSRLPRMRRSSRERGHVIVEDQRKTVRTPEKSERRESRQTGDGIEVGVEARQLRDAM